MYNAFEVFIFVLSCGYIYDFIVHLITMYMPKYIIYAIQEAHRVSLHKKSNFLYCNKDWLRSLCDYISATHINEQNTEIIQELNLSNVNISIGSDESESLEYITSILQLCQQHNIMKTLHISIRYIGYCILHYTVFCCLLFVIFYLLRTCLFYIITYI